MDRQTDGQTGAQIDRQPARQTDRQTNKNPRKGVYNGNMVERRVFFFSFGRELVKMAKKD